MTLLPRAFRPVYQYTFAKGQVRARKVLNRKLWHARNVVYARVCGKRVVYVGKADGTLRGRITRHIKFFPSAPKSKEYRAFAEGKIVIIFAYKPRPIWRFGMAIPIHGSIEAALIKKLRRPKNWFVKRGG